jgi:hypothetical protein
MMGILFKDWTKPGETLFPLRPPLAPPDRRHASGSWLEYRVHGVAFYELCPVSRLPIARSRLRTDGGDLHIGSGSVQSCAHFEQRHQLMLLSIGKNENRHLRIARAKFLGREPSTSIVLRLQYRDKRIHDLRRPPISPR